MEIELKDPPMWLHTVICSLSNMDKWVKFTYSFSSGFTGYKVIADTMCQDNISYVFDDKGDLKIYEH